MDSKNGWLLLSASPTIKFELVFVLTLENETLKQISWKTEIFFKKLWYGFLVGSTD